MVPRHTVPNLDMMTHEELWAFWKKHSVLTFHGAAMLVGDKRWRYTLIFRDLAAYACNKSVAIQERLKGNIESALGYEKVCEVIYARLPADIRW